MSLIDMQELPLKFSFMGERALLCEPQGDDNVLQLGIQQRIWRLAESASQYAGVSEVVPGMNNLLVLFDPLSEAADTLIPEIERLWSQPFDASADTIASRVHRIPVIYGGAQGEDLAELAAYTGLSVEEVIERHSASEYIVYALGSQPGLPYLGGLDAKLAMPRRATPRTRASAGSIIIGGAQASVLSRTSACGWHIIGHTDIECFNPDKDPPALFAPGDRVHFVVKDVRS